MIRVCVCVCARVYIVHRLQGAEAAEDVWWQLRQLIVVQEKSPVGRRRETLSGSHSSLSQHFNACLSRYIYLNQETWYVCVCVCALKHIHLVVCEYFPLWILQEFICTQTSKNCWGRWRRLMEATSADCGQDQHSCGEERDIVRLTLVAITAL